MPAGEVFIKFHSGMTSTPANRYNYDSAHDTFTQNNAGDWVDVYKQYGLSFSDTALSALMTPAPNKAMIENVSRKQDGKRIIKDTQYVKKDSRDLSLEMHITARTKALWIQKYNSFCNEILSHGYLELMHSALGGVVYRLTYQSCSQFSEFMMQMAKYTLRVNEPDPANRGLTDLDYTFTVKSSVTGNPYQQKLYERFPDTNDYRITWDISPVSGKTYYELS